MLSFKAIAISSLISAASAVIINSPATLIVCQPVALSWSGGTAPYFLSVIPGGQSGAAALLNFGEQQGTSFTWIVNITAGTSVSLAITDATGVPNYSSPVTINAGTSTSCIGASNNAASAPAVVVATTAAVAKTSAAAATSAAVVATSAAAPVVVASSAAPVAASSAAVSSAATTASGTAAAVTPKSTSGSNTLTISSLLVAAAFALMV